MVGGECIGNISQDNKSINCTLQLLLKGRGKQVEVQMLNWWLIQIPTEIAT